MRRRWRAAALGAALLGASPAQAIEPTWGYIEYGRISGYPHYDESGYGDAARLSVPLGDSLYFSTAFDRLDAQYDRGGIAERLTVGMVGLGLHTTGSSNQVFAQLLYSQKRLDQYAPTSYKDFAEGPGFTVGMRWLATPWLSVEPQGGLKGYYWDGFLKATVAARLMSHVWATGEYSYNVINGREFLAGLRITWSDYTAAQSPGATLVGAAPDRERELAVGQTLVLLRTVVPQIRPADGAPELAPLPKDTKIVLRESLANEFGTWWRIESGDQPQWIRESDLKGRL